ncbi:metallophosphoesterase [Paraburkholderia hospita]|uniref:metallophosphoesterase family protein n=1 Tax=Paraburkholderia hospita TaxID=169430 RepID=UPI003ED0D88B
MTRQLTWLHLSDIHFCAKDAWRDSGARHALLQFLRDELGSSLPAPDIVFCTGDIAFGEMRAQSLDEQYAEAHIFLLEVLALLGSINNEVDARRLFIVPGNHDVDRDAVNSDAQSHVVSLARDSRRHIVEFNNRVAGKTTVYKHAMKRLAAYEQFVSKACPHVAFDAPHLHYAHALSVNGIKLQVVGLNSAWNCAGDEEERRLWVGAQAQLSCVTRDESLRIGLVHHPLEWMTKPDASLLEQRMGVDLHYLLHGHEHEFRVIDVQGGYSVIGTGAVSAESSDEHGVVIARLDLDSRMQDRHVLVYSSNDGRWSRSERCSKEQIVLPDCLVAQLEGATTHRPPVGSPVRPPYSLFFSREGRYGAHEEYDDRVERSVGTLNRDSVYFRTLWRDVFNHHCVNRLVGDPKELHFQKGDASRLFSKDNIDAYFVRNEMESPTMTATANNDIDDKNDMKLSFDEFVKYVSDPALIGEPGKSTQGENRISYLIGNAGIGKTLTVLKLCDTLRNGPHVESGLRPVPVYKDFHEERTWNQTSAEVALATSLQSLGQEFLTELSFCASPSQIPDSIRFDSPDTAEEQLRQLCSIAAKAKYYPVFILDNGDRFFFENARYRFFREYARQQEWRLDDTLIALIDRFVSEHALGKVGACVLLVCRKYVYRYCRRGSDAADPTGPVRRDHKVFQLMDLGAEKVILSRLRVIDTALTKLDNVYTNSQMFKDRFASIKSRLASWENKARTSLLGTIWELAHQGHRSFLNFLSALPVDVRRDSHLIERLLDTPHVLLRLYIANMHKRYTERQGHFPNIYLNDCTIDAEEKFERAHRPHIHTYWLRYLILKYISSKRGVCHSEPLVEFFVQRLGYEEHLVRLSLGILSDPSSCNCLEIVMPDQLKRHEEILGLSRRGLILVEERGGREPLCFSFDYLQLITDDYLLSLPRSVASEIFVNADLGHTLKDGHEYARGARNVLRAKIPAVIRFFLVLEASFHAEMRHREAEAAVESLMPDFRGIGEKLVSSIEAVLNQFDDFDALKSAVAPRPIWEDAELKRQIEGVLADYYNAPVNVAL